MSESSNVEVFIKEDSLKNKLSVRSYLNGKLDGLQQDWHKNRKLKYQSNYENGVLVGSETYYYPNGNKKKETTFQNGEEVMMKEWYPNSAKKSLYTNKKMVNYTRDGRIVDSSGRILKTKNGLWLDMQGKIATETDARKQVKSRLFIS
jgi:antitoxin component YwqK of YwqJK toxin-antitoxin module